MLAVRLAWKRARRDMSGGVTSGRFVLAAMLHHNRDVPRIAITMLLAIAACASAQTPPAQLLSSGEPSQLAWGAYLAANAQDKSLIPAILPLLRSRNSGVQLAAIDALIRLDADVPEEDLAVYLDSNPPDPVLVLLARDPKKHGDFLLRMLDRPLSETAWMAVNGILLMAPPPGYAARLVRDWTLQYNVEVWDWDSRQYPPAIPLDGGPCSWGCSTYHAPNTPEGFPPQSICVISQGPWSRASPLVAGPHPLVYQIFTTAGYGPGLDRYLTVRDRDRSTEDYLRAVLSAGPVADLPGRERNLWWSTRYRTDAENFMGQIRRGVAAYRKELVDRGLLTAAEAAAGPKLEVVVTDHRPVPRDPLPVINWRLDP
jgi:hypothetical protein